MAGSNWEQWGVDLATLKPHPWGNVAFTSAASGVTVEIYKNQVSVLHPQGWTPASHWIEPIVAKVQHGDLDYQDVSLIVHELEVPRPARFAFAYCVSRGDARVVSGFAGLGIYGFAENGDWVGVTDHDRARLADWVEQLDRGDLGTDLLTQLDQILRGPLAP